MRLLDRARAGDQRAQDELFERYIPLLRRWARGRLPSWARRGLDTDDLARDAVRETLHQLDTFHWRREGALQTYLREAILSRIKDELRRAAPAAPPLLSERDSAPAPIDGAIGPEAVDRYERALQRLSPVERESVIARVEFGYSYEQVAEVIGRPSRDAARVVVRRALLHLAQLMTHAA